MVNITCSCGSNEFIRKGFYNGKQRYKCKSCNSAFSPAGEVRKYNTYIKKKSCENEYINKMRNNEVNIVFGVNIDWLTSKKNRKVNLDDTPVPNLRCKNCSHSHVYIAGREVKKGLMRVMCYACDQGFIIKGI